MCYVWYSTNKIYIENAMASFPIYQISYASTVNKLREHESFFQVSNVILTKFWLKYTQTINFRIFLHGLIQPKLLYLNNGLDTKAYKKKVQRDIHRQTHVSKVIINMRRIVNNFINWKIPIYRNVHKYTHSHNS